MLLSFMADTVDWIFHFHFSRLVLNECVKNDCIYVQSFKIGELVEWCPVDSLSDVLSHNRFRGSVYCIAELTSPWGLSVQGREGHAGFAVVLRGGCIARVQGSKEKLSLASGELILMPHGAGYVVRDRAGSPVTPIDHILAEPAAPGEPLRFGGDGALSSLLIGCFEFDTGLRNPLIESLPDVVYLQSRDLQFEPWLDVLLKMLVSEGSQRRPGSDILVSRLTEMIFVQIIRAYVTHTRGCKESPSWLRALADPEIGAALNLIHSQPEAPWTVASLAGEVGLSRTAFAVRFSSIVGESPLSYLTSWRMQQAIKLMQSGRENLAFIAGEVGYGSEAAFAKAFKRVVGRPPGAYIRELGT